MTFLSLIAKGMIRFYQYVISPLLPGSCRYEPTCSTYAIKAIERFGPLTGLKLAAGRILRCHPWGGSGYDPVPKKSDTSSCGCESRPD